MTIKTITPHVSNEKINMINPNKEIIDLNKKRLLSISFNDYINKLASGNSLNDMLQYDNYYIKYIKYLSQKNSNNMIIYKPILKLLVSDIIKRLINYNFCHCDKNKCNENYIVNTIKKLMNVFQMVIILE